MATRRLAVIDLVSEFPPRGGAARDLLESLTRLGAVAEVHLFRLRLGEPFPRGQAGLGTACGETVIDLPSPSRETLVTAFVTAIREWGADAVFLADAWMIKPFLAAEMARRWPTLVRLYALEMFCPRNNECWRHDHPCGNHILRDAAVCRACVSDYQEIIFRHRGEQGNVLTFEQRLARVLEPDYEAAVKQALCDCRVVCSNDAVAGWVKEQGPRFPPVVLPGGVDAVFFRVPERQAAEVFRIVAHGRMDDPAKGADWLIEAVGELRRRGVAAELQLTRKSRPDSPDWLKELGWVDRNRLLDLLALADVAVMPSLWDEAFGLAALEAMAAGRPVIASDVPGPRMYIRTGLDGDLVRPGDVGALTDALEALWASPQLRRERAVNGRLRAAQFTWEKAAAGLAAEIESLLNSPLGPSLRH